MVLGRVGRGWLPGPVEAHLRWAATFQAVSEQGTHEQSSQLPLEGRFALPHPYLPHTWGLAVLIRGRKIIAY